MKPTTTNKAMLGVYERGRAARRANAPISSCPYKIAPLGCHRRNGGTWGAVYYRYWTRGWWDENEAIREGGDS